MATQSEHAQNLIQVFRQRIAAGLPPIRGYSEAAELLGFQGQDYTRTIGQACSRIDAASFESGWPMLALHMVRTDTGGVNPGSFSGEWAEWDDEISSTLNTHQWTVEQVDEVAKRLSQLDDAGAVALWAGYMRRESHRPGFIRWNLHRKLRAA